MENSNVCRNRGLSRSFIKKLLILISCFIVSVLTVYALYQVSDVANVVNNGFVRNFVYSKMLTPMFTKDMGSMNYYISGANNGKIYLSDYTRPSLLITSNMDFSDTHHLSLMLPYKSQRELNCSVDSPYVFLMNRKDSVILSYKMQSGSFSDPVSYKFDSLQFTLYAPVSSSSVIFRTIDTFLKQSSLAKTDLRSSYIIRQDKALEKQMDGFFCTDGTLRYNKENGRLIYTYYYRNQFICLDSNLSILYKANTIDTNSRAKIKIGGIKSKKIFSIEAPLTVNKKTFVSKNKLFIVSNLLADNENRVKFSAAAVVDVYNLTDGKYQFSVHIHDFNGKKVRDFYIVDNTLIALQGDYIVSYSLKYIGW